VAGTHSLGAGADLDREGGREGGRKGGRERECWKGPIKRREGKRKEGKI